MWKEASCIAFSLLGCDLASPGDSKIIVTAQQHIRAHSIDSSHNPYHHESLFWKLKARLCNIAELCLNPLGVRAYLMKTINGWFIGLPWRELTALVTYCTANPFLKWRWLESTQFFLCTISLHDLPIFLSKLCKKDSQRVSYPENNKFQTLLKPGANHHGYISISKSCCQQNALQA